MRPRQPAAPIKERSCHFCTNAIDEVDYKDIRLLQRYVSSSAKIQPRRRNGCCMRHQRLVSNAIKRARIMALMPFVVL